ncbi:RNA-dependent RNA polymerase, partial [Thalictrum thalictroides]
RVELGYVDVMGRTIQVSGFPSNVTAQLVKEFLETRAGEDSVYALKIRNTKSKGPTQRAFAVVQFTTTKGAETISSYQRLCYGTSNLKVRNMERDIVPKPRVMMLSLDVSALHFGCQVSDENFKVFWTEVNAVVNFGFGLRKVEVLLSHEHIDYKLEFSYDSIWQIQLHRSRSLKAKILVIQVFAAPRVFEKLSCSSGGIYGDPDLNYFRDTPDDQWVRTTDFTSSSCIGQSSAICLELPHSSNLSSIRQNFHSYREDECQFLLESGSCFSRSLELVPIVGPPLGLELPYNILFKVNSLVQSACLSGPTLDVTFFRLVHPRFIPIAHIECALEKLYYLRECCYQPVKWLTEQYLKYNASKHLLRSPSLSLDDGLVYIRRAQVTPSKVYFCGPEVNVSNRVIRHYHKYIDNFIRVSFVDEDWEKMRATDLSPRTTKDEDKRHTTLYNRILSTLKNGIVIGDKKFDFLAFSSSQLRDNSAWMFASDDGITAASIREWMGDFHEIKNVAKYAARLGQSFSSSTETLTVPRHEIEIIDDVEIVRNGKKYVFSDGIGKISLEFAHRVAKKCGINGYTPSSFQIRYGGYKGVVAVDPGSIKKLSLRKSMSKYTSTNTKLDVLTWSKFQPCFLNRQIITLLSTLGVKDHIFEKKQKEAVDQLDMILTDPLKAQEILEVMSPGENVNVLKEMLMCGYKPDVEPYLSLMLQTFRALKLLELRKKTRIFLPNGRSLMGCLDETKTLEYGQVFVQVSRMGIERNHGDTPFTLNVNQSDRRRFIVEGKVIVAKNPCLHPGDVRVLQAVNVPDLHHMVDCVVFPQKGSRPHPNECSGSDLDGDIYFVSWDSELIPPRQVDPMDYTPEATVQLDHDVTIEEVQEYFTNYIVNDSLGIIANAHTAFADKERNMAESDACIKLARLFSIAVDFNKTGVPAVIPPDLYVKLYPDFMDKPDKPTYESQRVIGKLFRAVKDISPQKSCIESFTKDVARRTYDCDMEVDGFEDYIDDAHFYKGEYDYKLGNLMDYYGVKTESEILGGSIIKLSKSFDIRKDVEAIGLAVRSLKKEARAWFEKKSSKSGSEEDDIYAKASAWYHVTYHHDYWGCYNEGMGRDHFLSFPWCVYDKLIYIKRMNSSRKKLAQSLRLF